MSRKVVNIEHAKMDLKKPLMSMSDRERMEAFYEITAELDEGMMEDARSGSNRSVQLVGVVLSKPGSLDRIVCAYEEYGDGEDFELCEEIAEELRPFLHKREQLRVATFDVDLAKLEAFEFPSKEMWDGRENEIGEYTESWRNYMRMHETRGLLTVVVTWLVGPGNKRLVYTWNIDHGDGCGMYEHALPTIDGVKWNKLLAKGERLDAVAYTIPPDALIKVSW